MWPKLLSTLPPEKAEELAKAAGVDFEAGKRGPKEGSLPRQAKVQLTVDDSFLSVNYNDTYVHNTRGKSRKSCERVCFRTSLGGFKLNLDTCLVCVGLHELTIE